MKETQEKIAAFVHDRDWERFHNPKDLAQAIAIEAGDVQEHFLWRNIEECQHYIRNKANREAVASEVADVMIYCLSFLNAMKLDAKEVILAKIEKNREKYPGDDLRVYKAGDMVA